MARTTVIGLSETLRELQKMDTEIVKEIRKDWRRIAKPAIRDIRDLTPNKEPLTGMRKGRLQYDPKKVDSRVGAYLRFPKKTRKTINVQYHSIFNLEQRDAGGSIFDIAGRKSSGGNKARRKMPDGSTKVLVFKQTFIANLKEYSPRGQYRAAASRSMWPGAEKSLPQLSNEIEQSVNDRIRQYNRQVRKF